MRVLLLILLYAAGCATGQPPAATAEAAPGPTAAPTAEQASPGAVAAPVAIPNAATPLPGVLTGGQPDDAQLEQLAAAGYGTVINLRALGEPGSESEANKVEALGMRYVSIPVAGADDLTEENARALSAAMATAEGKPLLLHCGSGNRAGALLALKAFFVDGQDAEAAVALGKRAGLTKLEPAVRERLHR